MKTPKLKTNPAAGLIADTLEHEALSAAEASRAMRIPRSRLSDIFAGRKGISADTALRLEQYLGISAALLIRLQADFDLSEAAQGKGKIIRREVTPHTTAA
ncbi:MAG: HigA family addiction module antidote protein [Verrucomicrobia subdivision 3 bacterium]|nr:HigA family addiction module antidote protein [Limisphaerales bacterium]